MEPATDSRSSCGSIADTVAARIWSRLPEDLLVSILGALHVVDAIRSGAVCASWHAAYAAFRRLHLRSPRQPPCLLYASDALGPAAAALHCPSTGATLRIPFPLARRPLLGSSHGWLVTADEASDLHLVNPVTGAQVALPPITALHHIKRGTDEDGEVLNSLPKSVNQTKYLVETPAGDILQVGGPRSMSTRRRQCNFHQTMWTTAKVVWTRVWSSTPLRCSCTKLTYIDRGRS